MLSWMLSRKAGERGGVREHMHTHQIEIEIEIEIEILILSRCYSLGAENGWTDAGRGGQTCFSGYHVLSRAHVQGNLCL